MALHVASSPSLHGCPSPPPAPPPFPNYGGPHCSSNSASSVHTFSSVFSSICSGRTTAAASCSPFLLGGGSAGVLRSRSCDAVIGRRTVRRQTLGRVYSANLVDLVGDGDDEELVRRTREFALKPLQRQREQPKDEDDLRASQAIRCSRSADDTWSSSPNYSPVTPVGIHGPVVDPLWLPVQGEPPEWEDHLAEIIKERKEKGKPWDNRMREAGESSCSVNKVFSSMVFIVREVQTYAIRLRELLVDEDLNGIMERVHREMNSSFVWLFQKVFFCTPTLMVSVMLLLANFTVYSMGHDAVMAAPAAAFPPGQTSTVASAEDTPSIFKHCVAKAISAGRTASIGGSGDGGGKTRPVTGAMDDGRSDEFHSSRRTVLLDGTSPATIDSVTKEEKGGDGTQNARSTSARGEEEAMLWQDMLDEAYRMRARVTDESLLDAGTLRRLVSPVTAEMEPEDYTGEHSRTELVYQRALSEDPDNVLLLSNYAQFIHLVLHDDERAGHYFKRAVGIRPADAEALSRYASFLWLCKKDLAAAEETYLEAIAADPGNTVHAANYAHFLWSTGGEDTCYPLDTDDA